MLKTVMSLITLFAIVSSPVWAQVPITGKKGVTYEQLIKDKTYVTIVLKGNISDINKRITNLDDSLIRYISSDGESHVYEKSMIKEIRVQTGKYRESESSLAQPAFTRSEQAIIQRASERTKVIFDDLKASLDIPQPLLIDRATQTQLEYIQSIRLATAVTLAAYGNKAGEEYLQSMMLDGDINKATTAATYYMMTGAEIPNKLIDDAFTTGERFTRANAARIVGISGNKSFIPELREMSKDQSPEIYPFAVRALGVLGDTQSLPEMNKGLVTLSQPKAEAAIFAISQLGSDGFLEDLNARYRGAKGIEKYRILRLLYVLGDDEAVNIIRDEGLNNFAYNKANALVLTENNDWAGINWIREYLNKPKDPNITNLFYQGFAAEVLYETTPNESAKILQELTRITPTEIYAKGHNSDTNYKATVAMFVHANSCEIIGRIGDKSMLTLLSTKVEDDSLLISLAACDAIAKIANREYLERSGEHYKFVGIREELLAEFFK